MGKSLTSNHSKVDNGVPLHSCTSTVLFPRGSSTRQLPATAAPLCGMPHEVGLCFSLQLLSPHHFPSLGEITRAKHQVQEEEKPQPSASHFRRPATHFGLHMDTNSVSTFQHLPSEGPSSAAGQEAQLQVLFLTIPSTVLLLAPT